jgi:uncharacterized membrane protein YdfJ with MMPL/SSD domain
MQSVGVGVITSIFSAILVNMTLVPALILVCPALISQWAAFGKQLSGASKSKCQQPPSNSAAASNFEPVDVGKRDDGHAPRTWSLCKFRADPREVASSQIETNSGNSMVQKAEENDAWMCWSMFATSRGASYLVLISLLLVGYFSFLRCSSLQQSMDMWLMSPRNASTTVTLKRFSQSFSAGMTGPYELLLLPSSACSGSAATAGAIYGADFWANATDLLQGLVAELFTDGQGMLTSVMYNYVGALENDINTRLEDGLRDLNGTMGSQKSQKWSRNLSKWYDYGKSYEQNSSNNVSKVYDHGKKEEKNSLTMPLPLAILFDPQAPYAARSKLCLNSKWSELPAASALLEKACLQFLRTEQCSDLKPFASDSKSWDQMFNSSFDFTTINELAEVCAAFQTQLKTSVTITRDAHFATLVPTQVPGSTEAMEWTRQCRKYLETNAQRYPCVAAHLGGPTAQILDVIDSIYSRTPLVLTVTMCICLVLVSSLTVSLVFGISSVTLICWTLLVVFAIGDLVYRGGLLEYVFGDAIPAVSGTGGLAWFVPPLTFSIIFGLGLDYNIFLLGLVCEYHCMGYSDRDALAYGVAKTGPVITSAGIIMAIAFLGLMLSTIPMLNQISLLMVVAVLIDTFFVRSLATPALHAPLKAWNWWPRECYPSEKENDDASSTDDHYALLEEDDFLK